ncbi:amidase signature domain-containing protein [Radiomyces spectabilis]|uniref:amidase signature domain-containing protein n=1 Tax=Radiomyces spectabilis TaxID=64574 RepID=UPI002220C667|nr:amidase signature domain-containing protein [Radiomyces spectabilis]KAI8377691.1 amidase signature domain-containing protein [Radiomyces spectabilis]
MSSTKDPQLLISGLSGWPLRAAVYAMEWLPLLSYKITKDSLIYELRNHHFTETPTMLPIPNRCIHKGTVPQKENFQLDASRKSISPFHSFWDYHEAYQSGKTTPSKVATRFLEAAKATEHCHWLRTYIEKDILVQAAASTERYARHQPLSQLDGVFIGIKEELDIQGLETKAGTSFINDGSPATSDSTIVKRLKDAGAIIVGHTVMQELGWDVFSVNPNTGTPMNPYGVNVSCGGSSGGSGGIVAAGLCPVSIGADGGGSIRIPSSFCGLYGLKTTFGRISAFGGERSDPTLNAYGPLAATADDMALTYAIIAGPDENDWYTLFQPPVSLANYDQTDSLQGITIAVVPEWNQDADLVFLERLEQFKNFYQRLGATIVEIDLPELFLAKRAHTITICSEMNDYANKFLRQKHQFLLHTRIMMGLSNNIYSIDYLRAQQMRTRMMDRLTDLFQHHHIDLILTPATGMQAPEISPGAMAHGMSNVNWTVKAMHYATLANLTGIPAVNLPAGFENGKPVGLQLMAEWWNEALLCRMAKISEKIPNIERQRPRQDYSTDLLS